MVGQERAALMVRQERAGQERVGQTGEQEPAEDKMAELEQVVEVAGQERTEQMAELEQVVEVAGQERAEQMAERVSVWMIFNSIQWNENVTVGTSSL